MTKSVNLQAGGNITVGLSLAEVREVAQLTFDANVMTMQGIAKQVVRERAAELRDEFINRLAEEKPQDVSKAADPDFQYALFEAQKAYARTGDSTLSNILVDMLIDRVGREQRTLVHVVLGESLTVGPKLTAEQFDILSVAFILHYTKLGDVGDAPQLRDLLRYKLAPFLGPWPVSQASYEHLEYAGCGKISVLNWTLPQLLRGTYPTAFPGPQDDPAVEEFVRSIQDPRAAILVDTWMSSAIKNFQLTTVGKAIAHANVKRRTGDKSDLAIWIN